GKHVWQCVGNGFAQRESSGRRCVFAVTGASAPGVCCAMRTLPLDPGQLLLMEGRYYLIADRQPAVKSGWLDVTAVEVSPVPCVGRTKPEPILFSGILAERYRGSKLEDVNAVISAEYTLIAPVSVALREYDLVDVERGAAAGVYIVTGVHRLSEWQAEYELKMEGDA
ncbi:MAG: hypothetical protein RSB55_10590, partial [Oscillospiraceae bacterium]